MIGPWPEARLKARICGGFLAAVHQVVERGHPLRGHLRQRNGRLAVMHAGAGQHRADGKIPVHGVQAQLGADPAFLMPLAVAFAPHVAGRGQIRQVLRQRARRVWARALRALGWRWQRAGGGELIDALGDEGVSQPDARAGRAALAAPRVAGGEAAQIGQRNDLAELLIPKITAAG